MARNNEIPLSVLKKKLHLLYHLILYAGSKQVANPWQDTHMHTVKSLFWQKPVTTNKGIIFASIYQSTGNCWVVIGENNHSPTMDYTMKMSPVYCRQGSIYLFTPGAIYLPQSTYRCVLGEVGGNWII